MNDTNMDDWGAEIGAEEMNDLLLDLHKRHSGKICQNADEDDDDDIFGEDDDDDFIEDDDDAILDDDDDWLDDDDEDDDLIDDDEPEGSYRHAAGQ